MDNLPFHTQLKIINYLTFSQVINFYNSLKLKIDPRLLESYSKDLESAQSLLPKYDGELRMILLCTDCKTMIPMKYYSSMDDPDRCSVNWNEIYYGDVDNLRCEDCNEIKMAEKYGSCDICDKILYSHIHIFILSKTGHDDEMTVCSYCRDDINSSEWIGWVDDEGNPI